MLTTAGKFICTFLAAGGVAFASQLGAAETGEAKKKFDYKDLRSMISRSQFKEASAHLEAPLRENDPEAFYYAGMICLMQKDMEKAAAHFKKGAALDEINSMFKLGQMYSLGISVPKDDSKAFELFRKVAERSDFASAIFQTGRMLLIGEGTAADPEKATEFLRRISEPGKDVETLPKAQLLLGAYLHEYGEAAKESSAGKELMAEAIRFLEYAAAQGESEAWVILGGIYYYGKRLPAPDKEKAALCYRAAAAAGVSKGFYNLGVLAIEKKKYDEALMWMKKAAAQGHTEAVHFVEKDYPALKQHRTAPLKRPLIND